MAAIRDMLDYRFLSNLRTSPDGGRCAMLVKQAREKENDYASRLYLREKGEPYCLDDRDDFLDLIWLDNETLLTERKNGKGCVLAAITLDGVETPLASLDYRVKLLAAPEENRVLLSARLPVTDEKRNEPDDYTVMEESPYYANGEGFTSKIRNRLLLWERDKSPEPITPADQDVKDWAVGKGFIFWSSRTVKILFDETHGVYSYHLAARAAKILVEPGTLRTGPMAVMGDDLVFAALPVEREQCYNPDLCAVPVTGGTVRVLASPDLSFGGSATSDCKHGAGFTFLARGDALYFVASREESSHIFRWREADGIRQLTREPGCVDMIALAGEEVLFAGQRNMGLQELHAVNDEERALSSLNAGVRGRPLRPVSFVNAEGTEIHGFVLLPPDTGHERRSRPAILNIHGGPKTNYAQIFHHEMQVLAQAGYIVMFCNPTGSDGRGGAFADINGRWGTVDYTDIMQFVDTVLELFPQIDPSRLGVMGGSYGGYMTNWIMGHTDRFAAAVSDRCVFNTVNMEATTDISPWFARQSMRASGYENPEALWDRSPLKFAADIKTPTLIVHGEEDYRCHVSQGLQLFTALKVQGVPARMCIFKGENHELCRTGKPRNRMRRLREIEAWMNRWLNA